MGEELEAEWASENPETRKAVEEALPFEGDANKWGDELYFSIPVDVGEEDAWAEVEPGTVAYWPQGNSLCIFWGPTPASTGEKPKAASPVNVVGRIGDVSKLEQVEGSSRVRVEKS